jgi:hypothetical protein
MNNNDELPFCDEIKTYFNSSSSSSSDNDVKLRYALAYDDLKAFLEVDDEFEDYNFKLCETQQGYFDPLEYAVQNNNKTDIIIKILMKTYSIYPQMFDYIFNNEEVFRYLLENELLSKLFVKVEVVNHEEEIADHFDRLFIRNLRTANISKVKLIGSMLSGLNHNDLVIAISRNPNITDVNLGNAKLTDEELEILLKNKSITSLDLFLDDNANEEKLSSILQNSSLTKLDLHASQYQLDTELLSILLNTKITQLGLSSSNLNNEEIIIFENNQQITSLDLYGNFIIYEDIVLLLASMENLTDLDVSHNNLTVTGLVALSRNSSLLHLNISYNGVRGQDGNILCTIFAVNTKLKSLNLAGNEINDKGVFTISLNKTLETLNLSENEITNHGAEYLGMYSKVSRLYLATNQYINNAGWLLLLKNNNLSYLNLCENSVNKQTRKALRQVNIQRKKDYQKQKETFLLGTHPRLGQQSSILKFSHSNLVDLKNLGSLIFDYMKPQKFTYDLCDYD